MCAVARENRSSEKFNISERSHVDELHDRDLLELGRQLSKVNCGRSPWRLLASELGLGKDDIARIQSNKENPGYEVIFCWSKHGDSTIRVLKNVFRDVLIRPDLVKTIDKARRS